MRFVNKNNNEHDHSTNPAFAAVFAFAIFALSVLLIVPSFASATVGIGRMWNDIPLQTYLRVNQNDSAHFFNFTIVTPSFDGPLTRYSIKAYRTDIPATLVYTFTESTNPGVGVYSYHGRFDLPARITGTLGSYEIRISGTDRTGHTATSTLSLDVVVPPNVPSNNTAPTASFTYFPIIPVVGQPVYFDGSASSDPDGNAVSYAWDFQNDGTWDAYGFAQVFIYTSSGDYTAMLSVSDERGGTANTTRAITVSAATNGTQSNATQPLVTQLSCFGNVTQGANQSCQVSVQSNGTAVNGALVSLNYVSGTQIGTCTTTNGGGCRVQYPANSLGTFTVYATATHPLYVNDTDTTPQFTYSVLARQYDIVNLKVFNDTLYSLEDYDFLRGEDLHVTFQVQDSSTGQFVGVGLVSNVDLVSSAGGQATLSRNSFSANTFYYSLSQIPLNHLFFGNRQVFSFVINMQNQTMGRVQIPLVIRNNIPSISALPPIVQVTVGGTTSLDLSAYGSDLEDRYPQISWAASETSANFNIQLVGNTLQISGQQAGTGTVSLTLADLDNDSATASLNINVVNVAVNNPPTISFTFSPSNPVVSQTVAFDASASSDPDGDPLTYTWNFGDGTAAATGVSPTHAFASPGTYTVTLTVSDGTLSGTITQAVSVVSVSVPPIPLGPSSVTLNGPYNVLVNQAIAVTAIPVNVTIVSYSWLFGDGTSMTSTSPSVQHAYSSIGDYVVNVVGQTAGGQAYAATTMVRVLEPAPAKWKAPVRQPSEGNIKITKLETYGMTDNDFERARVGDEVLVRIGLENDGDKKLEDVRITVMSLDLGIKMKSAYFNLGRGQDVSKEMIFPLDDVSPGFYVIVIRIGNEQHYRTEYSFLTVTD